MKYEIIAEAHEGVYSVEEEVLAVIDTDYDMEALRIYASMNQSVSWCESWKCYLINKTRKIFARSIL